MRNAFSFALGGGLDEVSQPLAIDPGRVIAALNHEAVESGYGRISGFERFDGQTSPTDFPFYLLNFTGATVAVVAGATLLGATSGATAIVLVNGALTLGAYDGTGSGTFGVRSITGSFDPSEQLLVGGTPVAVTNGEPIIGGASSGSDTEEAFSQTAIAYARELISEVPGSGMVRGVVEYEGSVYAFRDNSTETAASCYKSTDSGWVIVPLGHTLNFTAGAIEILEGQTITGMVSNATALVNRVIVQSGDWGTDDTAGYLVLSNIVGTFVAENLKVGAVTNVATIAAAPVAITLAPGGRYQFVTHNFYGASDLRRVYGCSGTNTAFEFDGSVYVPILTGMATDTPNHIAVYRNHLFLSFPGGSVQHSSPAEPISFEAVLGAAEIAVGSDVSDFIANVDALFILAEHGVFNLTGYDVSDWLLNTITLEAGALPWTGQRIGPGIYLDNRGLRSIETTQAYGNFAMATFTRTIKKTLRRKAMSGVLPTASTIVRTKDQYRLFYADGAGLSFYLGRKFPEPMYFELGKVVRCISSSESEQDIERVFFGSDDGFVYQLDKGNSFDGAAIEAYCQFPYAHMKSPNVLKRVHKVSMEIVATSGTQLGVSVEFDYSRNEQTSASSSTVEADGVGGLYGVTNWGEFFWSSPVENVVEADIDGQGRNASIIIYSNSNQISPYELRGATIYYGARGNIR